MTLGDVIRRYRYVNNLNMDEFAKKCDLSKSYVSMLENNKGPRGIPIKPSVETVYKVANAMGMSVDEMLDNIDQDVVVTHPNNIPFDAKNVSELKSSDKLEDYFIIEDYPKKQSVDTSLNAVTAYFKRFRELLEAAEGCTDEQIQVATNVLKSYKKDDK